MLADIIKVCRPQTRSGIASRLTFENEYARTMTVKEWRDRLPDLSKTPSIFLIYK
jgi:16S rRNA (cytidine1402-2'-O)-methyltransferase